MSQMQEAQLAILPLIAWRVWAITTSEPWEGVPGPVLRGAWGHPWPGPELEARCLNPPVRKSVFSAFLFGREKRAHQSPAPFLSCDCGIYARKPGDSDDLWVVRIAHLPMAGGFIEMSGVVIEGSKGFRAQRARLVGPVEVWVPCADCRSPATEIFIRDHLFRGRCNRHAAGDVPGMARDEWMDYVVPALGRRYRVPVVGVEEGVADGHR